jgi:hypothetical protein
MIEVFKTNVTEKENADSLLEQLHKVNYKANFDLEDCDRILRIECIKSIKIEEIISILNEASQKF